MAFWSKNNSSGLPKDLLTFLTEADGVYMKAYETKAVNLLKPLLDSQLFLRVSRLIQYDDPYRYFGSDKFRTTSWAIEHNSDDRVILTKDVKYSEIRTGSNFKLKVAKDYQEKWVVDKSSGFKIKDILIAS